MRRFRASACASAPRATAARRSPPTPTVSHAVLSWNRADYVREHDFLRQYVYKIHAESFVDEAHLRELLAQAQMVVDAALKEAR